VRIEFLIVFSIYIAIGSALATMSRRFFRGDIRDYYTGGGRLGALLAFGTYAATTYSAFMMIGLVGLAYATGVGALGFELAYLAFTVFLLSTTGYRIWTLSRHYKWVSPSQMLGEIYGTRLLEFTTSCIYLFAMLPYLAAQLQGLKGVFTYGGLSEVESIIVSSIIVYAWIITAGMWSVAATDTYQGFIMLSSGLAYLSWVLFALVPSTGYPLGNIISVTANSGYLGLTNFWSLPVFLAYTTPWIFFAITNPQVVARLYIARDEQSYKKSAVYFFIYGLMYTLIVVIVGLIARGLAEVGFLPRDLPRDSVTPALLNYMNPILGSIIAVSIIAAAVSTANSIVLAVSSSLLTTIGLKGRLIVARLLDAVLVFFAALLASANIGFIVDLSVLTSVILLPLAPITIMGVYLNKKPGPIIKYSPVLSAIVGVGISTYYAIVYGPRRAFLEQIMGLPLSLITLLSSSVILLGGYVFEKLYNRVHS
jgi:SSS family solute:Na+ symporter